MRSRITEFILLNLARKITGAYALWHGCAPESRQRIYYANHSSHGDLLLIWASLPPALRKETRPVAGADYWQKNAFRRFIANKVFRAVLIERGGASRYYNPVQDMSAALTGGSSLIIFPEGTRNTTSQLLLPFKTGLFRLAAAHPHVEIIPVWLENPHRVMPKGECLPVPLLCSVHFGSPLHLAEGEKRHEFLMRAAETLKALVPPSHQSA